MITGGGLVWLLVGVGVTTGGGGRVVSVITGGEEG